MQLLRHVAVIIEPKTPWIDRHEPDFESEIVGGAVPREYHRAVQAGIQDVADLGVDVDPRRSVAGDRYRGRGLVGQHDAQGVGSAVEQASHPQGVDRDLDLLAIRREPEQELGAGPTVSIAVAFFGDGASNQGTFHESINMAAVWQLPVIYFCENNLYAATTPAVKSHGQPDIAKRAAGYGIPGVIVDGMDVIAVYEAAGEAIDRGGVGSPLSR